MEKRGRAWPWAHGLKWARLLQGPWVLEPASALLPLPRGAAGTAVQTGAPEERCGAV